MTVACYDEDDDPCANEISKHKYAATIPRRHPPYLSLLTSLLRGGVTNRFDDARCTEQTAAIRPVSLTTCAGAVSRIASTPRLHHQCCQFDFKGGRVGRWSTPLRV
jgi:hypothetical protein